MSRFVYLLLVGASLAGFRSAVAQRVAVGPGSTVQGDYLRGVGIAAWGLGTYELNNARANRINTETAILANEYVSAVAQYQSDHFWHRRRRLSDQRNRLYSAILDRIRNRPDDRDIRNGESLNDVLTQLQNPSISPSSFRVRPVPLPTDWVRQIPFKLDKENLVFSMRRITAQGKEKWPPALQDPRFAVERRNYEQALDAVLEEQIEGKMTLPTMTRLETSVDELSKKLDRELVPSREKKYLEARNLINDFKKAAKDLFQSHNMQLALGDLDQYAGSTVYDLVTFMKRHKLGFAPSGTPEERALYPELYATLQAQLDLVRVATVGSTR